MRRSKESRTIRRSVTAQYLRAHSVHRRLPLVRLNTYLYLGWSSTAIALGWMLNWLGLGSLNSAFPHLTWVPWIFGGLGALLLIPSFPWYLHIQWALFSFYERFGCYPGDSQEAADRKGNGVKMKIQRLADECQRLRIEGERHRKPWGGKENHIYNRNTAGEPDHSELDRMNANMNLNDASANAARRKFEEAVDIANYPHFPFPYKLSRDIDDWLPTSKTKEARAGSTETKDWPLRSVK